MKFKLNSKHLLGFLLISFIVFDIQPPKFLKDLLNHLLGKIALFLLIVPFFKINIFIGILAVLAGYFLLVRSAAVNSFNPEDYMPSEQKKDIFYKKTLNNHFPKTLEEEMVKNMVPFVSKNNVVNTKFLPSSNDIHDAKKY